MNDPLDPPPIYWARSYDPAKRKSRTCLHLHRDQLAAESCAAGLEDELPGATVRRQDWSGISELRGEEWVPLDRHQRIGAQEESARLRSRGM